MTCKWPKLKDSRRHAESKTPPLMRKIDFDDL